MNDQFAVDQIADVIRGVISDAKGDSVIDPEYRARVVRNLVLTALPSGIREIIRERQRQIDEEGYTEEHDDAHSDFTLSRAAACYALAADTATPSERPYRFWPWEESAWKPSGEDPIRDLTKAGALIVAEIERLQRAERRFQEEGWRSQL